MKPKEIFQGGVWFIQKIKQNFVHARVWDEVKLFLAVDVPKTAF